MSEPLIGRPPKYSKEILEKTRKFFEEYEASYELPVMRTKDGVTTESMEFRANPPPSKVKLAKYLGVRRETIWDWCNEHKEFSNIVDKLYKEGVKECLVDNALMGNYSSPFAIFMSKNVMGWADKTVNETTMTHNFPKEITFTIKRLDGKP